MMLLLSVILFGLAAAQEPRNANECAFAQGTCQEGGHCPGDFKASGVCDSVRVCCVPPESHGYITDVNHPVSRSFSTRDVENVCKSNNGMCVTTEACPGTFVSDGRCSNGELCCKRASPSATPTKKINVGAGREVAEQSEEERVNNAPDVCSAKAGMCLDTASSTCPGTFVAAGRCKFGGLCCVRPGRLSVGGSAEGESNDAHSGDCSTRGGMCLDTKSTTCPGTFVASGRCSYGGLCCMRSTRIKAGSEQEEEEPVEACKAQGGMCVDTSSNTCPGTFVSKGRCDNGNLCCARKVVVGSDEDESTPEKEEKKEEQEHKAEEDECKTINGICIDSSNGVCPGTFVSSKSCGPARICCTPPKEEEVNPRSICKASNGICLSFQSGSCPGTFSARGSCGNGETCCIPPGDGSPEQCKAKKGMCVDFSNGACPGTFTPTGTCGFGQTCCSPPSIDEKEEENEDEKDEKEKEEERINMCKSNNGICIDSGSRNCPGTFVPNGACGAAQTCCVPPRPDDVFACKAKQGICLDIGQNACPGTFVSSGACGPAQTCCVPPAADPEAECKAKHGLCLDRKSCPGDFVANGSCRGSQTCCVSPADDKKEGHPCKGNGVCISSISGTCPGTFAVDGKGECPIHQVCCTPSTIDETKCIAKGGRCSAGCTTGAGGGKWLHGLCSGTEECCVGGELQPVIGKKYATYFLKTQIANKESAGTLVYIPSKYDKTDDLNIALFLSDDGDCVEAAASEEGVECSDGKSASNFNLIKKLEEADAQAVLVVLSVPTNAGKDITDLVRRGGLRNFFTELLRELKPVLGKQIEDLASIQLLSYGKTIFSAGLFLQDSDILPQLREVSLLGAAPGYGHTYPLFSFIQKNMRSFGPDASYQYRFRNVYNEQGQADNDILQKQVEAWWHVANQPNSLVLIDNVTNALPAEDLVIPLVFKLTDLKGEELVSDYFQLLLEATYGRDDKVAAARTTVQSQLSFLEETVNLQEDNTVESLLDSVLEEDDVNQDLDRAFRR